MSDSFHSGERAVQERAGKYFGGTIRETIPDIAAAFLLERPTIVVAGRDGEERMWVTMLAGSPGFMHAADPRTMSVQARPSSSDPLFPLIEHGGRIGTIVMDHRRRMRVNGILAPEPGGFAVATEQVYSNCGRYISERQLVGSGHDAEPTVHKGSQLTAEQAGRIRAADTFFIGTSHPDGPADASHRGGNPGFVQVDSPVTCRWPDYNGNSMFMTLGNLALNPRVGLLFPDWTTGGLLQLSGRAQIVWDESAARVLPGAERVVELTIDAVQETEHALGTHWGAPRLSKFNPS